jgi:type I restriction enzyme S subunit
MNSGGSVLPSSWARPHVREVGRVRLGRQRSPERQAGLFPTKYLRAGNIGEHGLDLTEVLEMDFDPQERRTYALAAGDVLLAEGSGSATHVGRPAVWRDEIPLCCFQNTVIRFRPHLCLPEYALMVFRHYTLTGTFATASRGIGVLHLGAKRFGELPFPLAPWPEQRRIVAEAGRREGELDRAETSLRSALERTYAQDDEILAAAASGALGRYASAERLFDSDADRLPDDWTESTVAEAGELMLGKALGGKARAEAKMHPYLRIANIGEDAIDFADLKEMPFTAAELERYALLPGDILITEASGRPAQLGRPSMFRGEMDDIGFQNHLVRFRARDHVDPAFALLLFRHYMRSGEFRKHARGSTSLANLSLSRLATIKFPVPPLPQQRILVAEAEERLAASGAQRDSIFAALEGTANLRAEILIAATGGRLVPQDETEESATALLERLGPPPTDVSAKLARVDSETQSPLVPKPPPTAEASPQDRVIAALKAADAPLSLPDLCRAAELDLNDVSQIEAMYLALRTQAPGDLQIHDSEAENATVRLKSHAP